MDSAHTSCPCGKLAAYKTTFNRGTWRGKNFAIRHCGVDLYGAKWCYDCATLEVTRKNLERAALQARRTETA